MFPPENWPLLRVPDTAVRSLSVPLVVSPTQRGSIPEPDTAHWTSWFAERLCAKAEPWDRVAAKIRRMVAFFIGNSSISLSFSVCTGECIRAFLH